MPISTCPPYFVAPYEVTIEAATLEGGSSPLGLPARRGYSRCRCGCGSTIWTIKSAPKFRSDVEAEKAGFAAVEELGSLQNRATMPRLLGQNSLLRLNKPRNISW